jgi:RNA polymerase sigma-70 factor (ECF subfamily)
VDPQLIVHLNIMPTAPGSVPDDSRWVPAASLRRPNPWKPRRIRDVQERMKSVGRHSGRDDEHEDQQADPLQDPLSSDLDATVPDADEPAQDAVEDAESVSDPQHPDQSGVGQDMATLALNPGLMGEGEFEDAADGRGKGLQADLQTVAGKPSETGDAEVMLRLKAGELECFDYLMNKYRRPIVHFMYRMVHNQAIAEEMAQEVFLRVYRSRETYRAEARFTTWLYRIATNLAVNHARDTKNERTAPTIHLDEPDPETGSMHDVADETPTIEADLLRAERMKAIKAQVMALPERQRTAVLMHKYQEMDYKQIGAVLKLSESATKSLLFRAYQTLRERLKEFV